MAETADRAAIPFRSILGSDKTRDDAAFLRSVLASSNDCIKVLDLDAKLVFMSEGGQRVMEVSDFNAIRGCPWPDFWQGDGNLAAIDAVRTAKAGGVGRFQGFARTMAGTPRWWDVQVTAILGDDGLPERLLSVSRDITALREAEVAAREGEERQAFITQEMAHRVKNTLAVVQAIASLSLRGDISLPDARTALFARLHAFAQANDLLLQANWTEASLRELARGVGRSFGADDDRMRITGPALTVGPRAALSIALVLHELATNAAKYGALSTADGRVDIQWRVDDADGEEHLHLTWRESNGPPVKPPSHKGFGSRLIERSLEQDLAAKVTTHYAPSGLTMTLVAPLRSTQRL